MKSYSQYKQDLIVKFILSNKKDGYFLDIGAHDGISFSNTYLFEKELGWNGLAIEANPFVHEKLKFNRKCKKINCCITNEGNKNVIFRCCTGPTEMLSGILDLMSDVHKKRIESEIKKNGGSYQDIEVSSIGINELISDYGIAEIDYCSIDVEGAEEIIVKSIDFNKIKINAFTIENNGKKNSVLRSYLKLHGYKFIKIAIDDLFVKNPSGIRLLLIKLYTYVFYILLAAKSKYKIIKSNLNSTNSFYSGKV